MLVARIHNSVQLPTSADNVTLLAVAVDHRPCSTHTHTHTHPFNGSLSGTTRVSRYQKGKTNLDFTEARDSEWQWHQLDRMQVCTLLQTDNHASTPPLSFLQAGCPSCRPTNSIKALKQSIDVSTRKPATRCCSGVSMGQTDGQTDGHRTVTYTPPHTIVIILFAQ